MGRAERFKGSAGELRCRRLGRSQSGATQRCWVGPIGGWGHYRRLRVLCICCGVLRPAKKTGRIPLDLAPRNPHPLSNGAPIADRSQHGL